MIKRAILEQFDAFRAALNFFYRFDTNGYFTEDTTPKLLLSFRNLQLFHWNGQKHRRLFGQMFVANGCPTRNFQMHSLAMQNLHCPSIHDVEKKIPKRSTKITDHFTCTFGYNDIGWNSVLYQSIEHRARELKLSRQLSNCIMSNHFPDFSLVYFLNWKWNFRTSKVANSNWRTKQRFVNLSSTVIEVIIVWAETKILKEKIK